MWHTVRQIFSLVFLAVALSVSAASAQYNAPAAPAAPSAPSAPSAPASAPPMAAPTGPAVYPFTVNVAIIGDRVVLTDDHGMTLYYLRNETSTMTKCTGRCATIWPPMLAPAGVSFDPAITPLTVLNNVNGPQLAYHGHLLYRFSRDTAPGQINGDGVVDTFGSWAAVMPGVAWNLSGGGGGY